MAASDVLVVGASPAGLAAALAAARAGARVTLLESKREVGVPEAPATLAFDFLWTASERPPPSSIRRRLAGVRLRSPLDAAHALEVQAPLSILRRAAFDRHLAGLAKQAGADVRVGVPGLRAMPDRTLEADGALHRATVVVFADGAGTLARAFLQPTRDPRALAWGAAFDVDAPGAAGEDLVTITPGSHAPGGRSQLNPLEGGRWSHWTFYRGAPEEAEARGREALALECRLRGWPASVARDARLAAIAPDPVYTLPGDLVADGVMVVGGAAGQGGLEVGVASGELAGGVAARAALAGRATKADLAPYERAWKRERMAGYRALRAAADRLARLDDARLDRLLAPWSGWRVPARDVVGLGHPSPLRRMEALAKFAARNPGAVPRAAITGLQALVAPRPSRG